MLAHRLTLWAVATLVTALCFWGLARWWALPLDPLTAPVGGTAISVLDFDVKLDIDSPPRGWRHRGFWFVPPMRLAQVTHQGVAALRCETRAGGSIFGRHTDLDLSRLPLLDWRWLVEVPITSTRDERTREGDDHPARLFLEFRDSANGRHAAEIIWANQPDNTGLKPGGYTYIGSFPHYVADGGNANIGRWRDQSVDLLAMYRTITRRTDSPRLTFLAVFCDSDNTATRGIAYTSSVRLRARSP